MMSLHPLVIAFLASLSCHLWSLESNLTLLTLGGTLLWIGLYAWLKWQWTKVQVIEEVDRPITYGTLIGDPEFDPTLGIVGHVEYKGETFPLLLQPKWWPYLGDSKVSQKNQDEGAIKNSFTSLVPSGKEPGSLVCITNEAGTVVGMGARVKANGEDFLLTANHVVSGFAGSLYITKNGLRAEFDYTKVVIGCEKSPFDFALIDVAPMVWSKLGVSQSPLKSMAKLSIPVVCYGGKKSTQLCSSMGVAIRNPKRGCLLAHTCTTTSGWSGTPLYSNGTVVGVHTGTEDYGVQNRATDVSPFVALGDETDWGNVPFNLMSEEELQSLSGDDYDDIEVKGRGKFKVSATGFARSSWADRVDDDDDDDSLFDERNLSAWKKKFYRETARDDPVGNVCGSKVEENLNCSRAEEAKLSPPSCPLATMTGLLEIESPKGECPSLSVEDRLSNLEKLVEQLLHSVSSMQLGLSQSLRSTPGPKEEAPQKEDLSSSKHPVSKKRRNRRKRGKQQKSSSENTPEPKAGNVPVVKGGTKSNLPKPLRRSQDVKSTGVPPRARR